MQDIEFRQLIERVKLRSPIEVVVGERVSGLRQRGALWWARCPFHEERTPSFAVDPRRGTWRCFGACGEGGDALSFVERFDGLSFLDSLRLLARQCGEEVPERSLRGRGGDAALEARHELMRWAADFYRRNLLRPEGSEAREYLRRRGLGQPVLEAFGVGWAQEGGQTLVAAAQEARKPIDALVELGLVRRAESGRPYDFFRRRVLIPIRDRLGRCVGFGGRILPAPAPGEGPEVEAGPKYINTPETILFHKGRLIFGLDLAADSVRRTGEILIVEGYTDVMAAHQAGWPCAVAVLGTATTEDHAALIRRSGARRVTLAFDGDEAGRRASTRALAGLLRLPVELRVAVLPEGRDPGDLLVEEQGRSEFRERVESARDWFDWSLEGLAGKRGGELSAAVEERFQLLQAIDRPVEQSSRLAELARFLALPEADVRAHWQAFERAHGPRAAAPAGAGGASRRSAPAPRALATSGAGLERAYGLLFGALLLDNSLVPVHAPLLAECPEGELKVLFGTLLDLYQRGEPGEPVDASALLSALADHPARARVVELQAQAEGAESPEVLARDQARWIERARAARELERLKRALSGTPLGEDQAAREVLARMLQELRVGRVPTAPRASAVSPEP